MTLRQRIAWVMKHAREWQRANGFGSRCVRLLMLISFTASSIGIPVGDWSLLAKADDSGASPWCRCSKSAKQSGTCCCAKRSAGATSGGCCSTRQKSLSTASVSTAKTKPGGCCSQKKPVQTEAASKPKANPHDEAPAWRSCGCGPTDSPMLLVSTEPRILTSTHAAILFSLAMSFPAASGLDRSPPLRSPRSSADFVTPVADRRMGTPARQTSVDETCAAHRQTGKSAHPPKSCADISSNTALCLVSSLPS